MAHKLTVEEPEMALNKMKPGKTTGHDDLQSLKFLCVLTRLWRRAKYLCVSSKSKPFRDKTRRLFRRLHELLYISKVSEKILNRQFLMSSSLVGPGFVTAGDTMDGMLAA